MGIFDLFGSRSNMQEGLETFRRTPGAVLLDVRTPEEYRQGHVPGSVNLPLDALPTAALPPKDRALFVYCHSGSRSGQACAWLRQKGYQATNIGGMMGYRGEVE